MAPRSARPHTVLGLIDRLGPAGLLATISLVAGSRAGRLATLDAHTAKQWEKLAQATAYLSDVFQDLR